MVSCLVPSVASGKLRLIVYEFSNFFLLHVRVIKLSLPRQRKERKKKKNVLGAYKSSETCQKIAILFFPPRNLFRNPSNSFLSKDFLSPLLLYYKFPCGCNARCSPGAFSYEVPLFVHQPKLENKLFFSQPMHKYF